MKYKLSIVLPWFERNGIVTPEAEFRFNKDRKWRFDFAWPEHKIALEVEGAVWAGGRHTRGSGFVADMEKYNCAVTMGWRVLRTTPQNLCMMETVNMLKAAMSLDKPAGI
jgi:very-short-patch-repair endonuclease